MIIDIHTHAWPDTISQKAQTTLEGLFKIQCVADPTLANLTYYMERNHVLISVVSSVATRPQHVPSINDWLFSIKSDSIKIFCALHPDFLDWKKELTRIKKYGDGIKLQPEFQGFYVDEARMFPVYEEIARLKLPLLFHAGEELSVNAETEIRSSPRRLITIKEHIPEITLIAAHFGGFRVIDEVILCLLGKDIYVDTSFFFNYHSRERIRELILAHRPDRILFGSDFPLIDPKNDIDFLNSLDISSELREKIFFRNSAELLNLKFS